MTNPPSPDALSRQVARARRRRGWRRAAGAVLTGALVNLVAERGLLAAGVAEGRADWAAVAIAGAVAAGVALRGRSPAPARRAAT